MNYETIGSVCSECATNAGFVSKKDVCGVWMDECGICHKTKPCTDLWHDWMIAGNNHRKPNQKGDK